MQTRGVKVRAYPDFLLGPLTWENYVGILRTLDLTT